MSWFRDFCIKWTLVTFYGMHKAIALIQHYYSTQATRRPCHIFDGNADILRDRDKVDQLSHPWLRNLSNFELSVLKVGWLRRFRKGISTPCIACLVISAMSFIFLNTKWSHWLLWFTHNFKVIQADGWRSMFIYFSARLSLLLTSGELIKMAHGM